MPVAHMLSAISSQELTEWQAFEQAFGPVIGREYENETLAAIHEQLQFIARMTGAQFGEDNPVPPPTRWPRPPDMMNRRPDVPDEMSQDEFNEQF